MAGPEHSAGARRSTRQRQAIVEAMRAAARPLLPAEVLALSRSAIPSLGLATVYRTLKLLVDGGEVRPVHLPGEPARFEASQHLHQHHFLCDRCRRAFPLVGCPGHLKDLVPQGFSLTGHDVTLYGLCDECATGRGAA